MRHTHLFGVFLVVVGGCGVFKGKKQTPCEAYNAVVAECWEVATAAESVTYDSGAWSPGDTGGPGIAPTPVDCANSAEDEEWLTDLYACYVDVYEANSCARPEGLANIAAGVADCALDAIRG